MSQAQDKATFEPYKLTITASPNPQWVKGPDDSLNTSDPSSSSTKVTIDPYEEGRNTVDNYRLLTSAVAPRPIALVSTVSVEGVKNLAPFSYFNMVSSDPPIFVVGFSHGRPATEDDNGRKDSCKNLLETKECTISIISEWFVEAANATSENAPRGVEEWGLVGLTPEPSKIVEPPVVQESAFSIECKLVTHHEWYSKKDAESKRITGTTCIVEGVMFHARDDVLNDTRDGLDLAKLRPISRLGGITYGRSQDVFDLPRKNWSDRKDSS